MKTNYTSKKGLKQKIVTGVAVGLTGILGIFNIGCNEQANINEKIPGTPEYEQLQLTKRVNKPLFDLCTLGFSSMLGAGAADTGDIRRDAAVRGIGQGIQAEKMNDAIRGSGNVNLEVNLSEQQNYSQQANKISYEKINQQTLPERIGNWIRPPESFACTGFADLNKDGYIGKDELEGVRNYFKYEDVYIKPIIIGAVWDNAKLDSISVRITDLKNNKSFFSQREPTNSKNYTTWNPINFKKEKGGYGISENRIEFFRNGRLVPEKTFSIFIDYGEKEVTNSN